MKPKFSLVTAVVGAALALGVPAAWGNQQFRDAGDAMTAKTQLESARVVVRDAGDAAGAQARVTPRAVVSRDAGDATTARLTLERRSVVVHDAGDATAARHVLASKGSAGSSTQWVIAPVFGLAFAAALIAVLVAARSARTRHLAH